MVSGSVVYRSQISRDEFTASWTPFQTEEEACKRGTNTFLKVTNTLQPKVQSFKSDKMDLDHLINLKYNKSKFEKRKYKNVVDTWFMI